MHRHMNTDRHQTLGEEIANALSHGLGCLLAVAALPILVQSAAQHGGTANVVAASLFAGTMIVLYLTSTLYHALPRGMPRSGSTASTTPRSICSSPAATCLSCSAF